MCQHYLCHRLIKLCLSTLQFVYFVLSLFHRDRSITHNILVITVLS
jgi:hypothetical protein